MTRCFKLRCSACALDASFLGHWFCLYVVEGERHRTFASPAWCYDCRTVRPAERLPSLAAIERRLAGDSVASRDATIEAFAKAIGFPAGGKPTTEERAQLEELVELVGPPAGGKPTSEELARLHRERDWLQRRTSGRRCLVCSGTRLEDSIYSLTVHPDCGGDLQVVQVGMFAISSVFGPLDFDGMPMEAEAGDRTGDLEVPEEWDS